MPIDYGGFYGGSGLSGDGPFAESLTVRHDLAPERSAIVEFEAYRDFPLRSEFLRLANSLGLSHYFDAAQKNDAWSVQAITSKNPWNPRQSDMPSRWSAGIDGWTQVWLEYLMLKQDIPKKPGGVKRAYLACSCVTWHYSSDPTSVQTSLVIKVDQWVGATTSDIVRYKTVADKLGRKVQELLETRRI